MIDPAYCADGCGRLAARERARGFGAPELVCRECYCAWLDTVLKDIADERLTFGEHSSNPREDG